jgi:hypothetical protein
VLISELRGEVMAATLRDVIAASKPGSIPFST